MDGIQLLRHVYAMTAVRLRAAPAATVRFTVDGAVVEGRPGESLAACLMAAGRLVLRASPVAGTPRGAFCMMGVCQECLVRVDGTLQQACLLPIADGMAVIL